MWKTAQDGKEGGEVLFEGKVPPQAVESVGTRLLRGLGRGAFWLAVAYTIWDLGKATWNSIKTGSFKPIEKEITRQIGGWAAAWAGAKAGAAFGALVTSETGLGSVIGGLVGSAVLGTAGYYGADWAASKIFEK
jgi:hypothetical protein